MAFPEKRRYGLGTRLSEIIANTPQYGEQAAAALFGGAGTASEEEIRQALRYVSGEDAPTETEFGAAEKPPMVLPPPEYIDYIPQSSRPGYVKTKRPDRFERYGFYFGGPNSSTRVHAAQWIPTFIGGGNDGGESLLQPEMYGYRSEGAGTYGDILVAFARPSKNQAHSLYVFENNSEQTWNSFKSAYSLGRAVGILTGGRSYREVDGERYKDLHKNTTDGGAPYDNWIFGEDQMPRWMTIRPDNERL